MCIPRTTLTRYHSLVSSFVSVSGLFPMQFLMRFSCRQNHSTSSDIQGVELVHTVCSQLLCVCGYRCHLTLNCSSALRLELLVSFGTAVVTLKFLFWYKPCGIVWTLQQPENSTILPGPSAVLNDEDEGGLSVASMGLLFSKPFPWFRVKMLTHFEDFLEL